MVSSSERAVCHFRAEWGRLRDGPHALLAGGRAVTHEDEPSWPSGLAGSSLAQGHRPHTEGPPSGTGVHRSSTGTGRERRAAPTQRTREAGRQSQCRWPRGGRICASPTGAECRTDLAWPPAPPGSAAAASPPPARRAGPRPGRRWASRWGPPGPPGPPRRRRCRRPA